MLQLDMLRQTSLRLPHVNALNMAAVSARIR
jgi:hypothetical protein